MEAWNTSFSSRGIFFFVLQNWHSEMVLCWLKYFSSFLFLTIEIRLLSFSKEAVAVENNNVNDEWYILLKLLHD